MSILKVDELQSRTSGNRITLPDVNNYPPYRNLIINGDMSIAQRGTSSTSQTSASYKTCDRFRISINTLGTWTITQDSDTPSNQGFGYSLKLQCTTADASPASTDDLYIQHKIEGQNLTQLKYGGSGAESLTLSFWVKSNKTGTASLNFLQRDNSAKLYTTTYSISSANTWEKKTITISGDTSGVINNDNGSGFEIIWWLNSGSLYTSGTTRNSWSSYADGDTNASNLGLGGSTSDYINITGVQLEVGTSATPFEFLPFDVNLKRCERYYEKSYDYGTTAGTATEGGTSSLNGLSTSSKQIRSHDTRFTVEKRVDPTVTIYDKSGNSGKWTTYDSGGSATDNVAYGGVITKNTKSFDIYSSGTTAAGYQFHYTVDAEL